MTAKRDVITEGLVLNTTSDNPGRLCITVHDPDGGRYPRFRILTPEEVDKLVLSALSMTKPEDLDPNAEEDYQAAVEAIRAWQGKRAARESIRQRDVERDAVLREAGYVQPMYAGAGPAIRYLVDQLIEARKAGQK